MRVKRIRVYDIFVILGLFLIKFREKQQFSPIYLMAFHQKLGSIVLDHHARYTEADVIPCTGEEPGEAKEREALRGAVLKQVWSQTLGVP